MRSGSSSRRSTSLRRWRVSPSRQSRSTRSSGRGRGAAALRAPSSGRTERAAALPVELLARRQTARAAYDRGPADEAALVALQKIAREAGHEAWFTSDRELVDWVVGLNADTLFYDLDDDCIRAEIGRWIRTSQAEARRTGDGFPRHLDFPARSSASSSSTIACSRAGPCEASLAGSTCTTRGTATVGWLRGPWELPRDWFAAGRMLMRFWLELTRLASTCSRSAP